MFKHDHDKAASVEPPYARGSGQRESLGSEQARASTPVLREYLDGGGVSMNTLMELGFDIDSHVTETSNRDVEQAYRIVAITETTATLQPVKGSGDEKEIPTAELIDYYRVLKKQSFKSFDLISEIPQTEENVEVQAAAHACMFQLALRSLHAECAIDKLRIQTEPDRRVYLKEGKTLTANEIICVPYTTGVSFSEKCPSTAVMLARLNGLYIYASKRETWPSMEEAATGQATRKISPFVVPWWSVREVKNPTDVTVHRSLQTYNIEGMELDVPVLRATTRLSAEEELTVLVKSDDKGKDGKGKEGKGTDGKGKEGKGKKGKGKDGEGGKDGESGRGHGKGGKGGKGKGKGNGGKDGEGGRGRGKKRRHEE